MWKRIFAAGPHKLGNRICPVNGHKFIPVLVTESIIDNFERIEIRDNDADGKHS